jgi:hypothetical protein
MDHSTLLILSHNLSYFPDHLRSVHELFGFDMDRDVFHGVRL